MRTTKVNESKAETPALLYAKMAGVLYLVIIVCGIY